MGLNNSGWRNDLTAALNANGIVTEFVSSSTFTLLRLNQSSRLLINLLSIGKDVTVEELVNLQLTYKNKNIQIIQLWEDSWATRAAQVLSRINSLIGLNKTVHGRKTKIVSVKQETANDFFGQYHLHGTAGCKYRFGLELDNELIAVAGFSAKRPMNHTEGYTSAELIRFATVSGITVTGGLSKLIRHFIQVAAPNDIMSYADLDWSDGKGYVKLGFKLVAETPPMQIFLNLSTMERFFPHRLPSQLQEALATMEDEQRLPYLKKLNYVPVFNTGNLKYILYL